MKLFCYVPIISVTFMCFFIGGCQFIRVDNLNQSIAKGDMTEVKKAVEKGVNVNGKGMHSVTPLMKAARLGRLDIAKFLIENGADVNGQNDSGTVLMGAVVSGNADLVTLLLDRGADKSKKNALGYSALDIAKNEKLTNIVKILAGHD